MAPPTSDTGYGPRMRQGPRALLKRLREIMAAETEAQARLDQLVRSIAGNLVADVCSIYVRRPDDMLELFATAGLNPKAVHATRLSMHEGLVGWVARHRRPIKLKEAQTHPHFVYREETGEDPYNAFLGVPIVRSAQVLGVLVVQNIALREFTEEETEIAQTVATVLAEIVSSGELLDKADRQDVEAVLHQPEQARGTPIVPGIAVGIAVLRTPRPKAHATFARDVATEQARLDDALAQMRKSVDDMVASDTELQGTSREILEIFRLFAYDKGWARKLEEKILSGLTAESAVEQVAEENRARMRSVSDPYLRERFHDLEDLSRRLLRALSGETDEVLALPENAILVADNLGPAEILDLDRDRLSGIVLGEGAATSHAAIVARSLNVPMVSGLGDLIDRAEPGDDIALDGGTGEVHLRPPETARIGFADKAQLRSEALARYTALRDEPAVTLDGVSVDLQINAGLLLDMAYLEDTGASSVGLFRTELQFLLAKSLPTAAEQEQLYRDVLDAAKGKPVIFRTADIGSDKRAGYMETSQEANPAMGWRGLRVSIDREGLMRTQIRALLSAAQDRPLAVMMPLVTTVEEFRRAKTIVSKEIQRHERHVGALPPRIDIGAMIEIPSAAWDAARLSAEADFLSIGGNDLAQFFFAADRETDAVSSRYDALSPPFLGFLERIIREGREGVPIGFCGEHAADPLMALTLMAFGIDRLSVAPGAIGPLKAAIRSTNMAQFREALSRLMADPDSGEGNFRTALLAAALKQGIELP